MMKRKKEPYLLWFVTFVCVAVCWISAFAAFAPMPAPQVELESKVSDTNETQQTAPASSVILFVGQSFLMTNCFLLNEDESRYGGTNYSIKVTIGNSDEGTRNWNVFGDGSTNYTGNDGAWVAADTTWWARMYMPVYTGLVYMQIKVLKDGGGEFVYPLRGVPYYTPLD